MFKYSIILVAVTTAINSYAQSSTPENTTNITQETQIQKLDDVVVIANPLGISTTSNISTSIISKQKIREQSGTGLGQILQNTTGVSTTGFGAVANRPSIRGLEGDRIKIMQNGSTLFDASNISYDHAVPVNPITIDKVEIIKGTNTLLYGGNALGGVVNVVDNRIGKQKIEGIHGNINTSFGGANNERSGAVKIKAGINENIVLNADVFSTKTSDIKIKNFARSNILRTLEPLPLNDEIRNKLPNTDSQSSGGAIGLSYINNTGFTGISVDSYNQKYGSPVEENVRIKLKQNKFAFETEQKIHQYGIESLSFKSNFSDYQHKEIENGEVGTTFKNKANEFSLQLKHIPINFGSYKVSGIFGTQYQNSKFSALGEEAFIPTTKSQNIAFYAIEKFPLSLNTENSYLQFGVRVQNNSIKADIDNNPHFNNLINNNDKSFTTYSTSASIFHKLTSNLNTILSLNYAQRAPTFYELFANGIHIATNAYEIGDVSFNKEKSVGIDLGLKYKNEGYEVKANIYANKFKNYIASQNTGIKVDEDGNPDINGVSQYKYISTPAQFYGFELEGKIPLNIFTTTNTINAKKISLLWQSDYTRAYNKDTNEPLPRISPIRVGLGLAYEYNNWQAKLKALYNAKQNKVAANDIVSPSYTDLILHIERSFTTKYGNLSLFVRGDNLLNKDIRPAADFLRNVAPYGKRSIKVGMNLEF